MQPIRSKLAHHHSHHQTLQPPLNSIIPVRCRSHPDNPTPSTIASFYRERRSCPCRFAVAPGSRATPGVFLFWRRGSLAVQWLSGWAHSLALMPRWCGGSAAAPVAAVGGACSCGTVLALPQSVPVGRSAVGTLLACARVRPPSPVAWSLPVQYQCHLCSWHRLCISFTVFIRGQSSMCCPANLVPA